MTSIRRFLVIILAASITLFNFVAALQGYLKGIEKTEILLDRQLTEISTLLLSVNEHHEKILNDFDRDDVALQFWTNEKKLITKTENAPDISIAEFEPGFSYNNFGGYRWRTFALQDTANNIWILIAERADTRYILAEEVILSSILPIVVGLPIICLLIWFIVGNGLQPLKRLAGELKQKKPQDLSPLSESNVPEELEQLVESTNDLLNRLSNSFERERRFSGDAAHELRTPLSVIKIELFNLLQAYPEKQASFDRINNSINRMVHLIEQLLTLYRMSPEQYIAKFNEVDMEQVAKDVLQEQYQHIESKKQTISLESEASLLVGDEFALHTLIKNLVDNANKYTPEGGEIVVHLINREDSILLAVEDSGPGIPEELHDRVFDRFYRVDGDQHRSQVQGCGLGMSIVKHIVDLHKGEISLKPSTFETGLCVEVSLPKAQV